MLHPTLRILSLRILGLLFLVLFNLPTVGSQEAPAEPAKPDATAIDSFFLDSLPPQPDEESWQFIEDLKSPLWSHHAWESTQESSAAVLNQADLSQGVTIREDFPDPKGRLETAYRDLRAFFDAGDVSHEKGDYVIAPKKVDDLEGEAFRVEVKPKGCDLYAGDVEGIRRGIFHIEDEMRRLRAARLPLGTVKKKPVVLRRISRCFFGPIKRPPKMKDELMDDVNYYPDQYLNRLAHEGVNGLWLTVEFRDLVKNSLTPHDGEDAEKRIAKLRQTVDACLKYGIRTYMFCIEPRRWEKGNPVLKDHPEIVGTPYYYGNYFCPSSQKGHDYLYESVNTIFKSVPGLGGIINITHGERGTTCLSVVPADRAYKGIIKCPRCADKKPWQILHASLSAMEQGMHDADPDAELISWLYMPQPNRSLKSDPAEVADWVFELPKNFPKGVILQFNFESGVTREVFGKKLVGGDYWISTPGPSSRFERVARSAREHGTQVSAKIQTGNSHEVATTPYVPVPSLLYRKFAEMHRLGVSHTMMCWYFGSYPGLMNKAAGLLSMEPFPEDEHAFLNQLAAIDWKEEDVAKVVKAWEHFSEGYQNFPLTNMFQYYGPMHDGPVWPLLLKPVDAPLAQSWELNSWMTREAWPPSGDRVGECIGNILTLEEVAELAQRITTSWDKGLELLEAIEPHYAGEPERILDLGVAKALGIQFRSGHNILRFYLLREKMFRMQGEDRLALLDQIADILREEIQGDEQLHALCEQDSRLGFHSEAEGYKYFPEKIRWRMNQLKHVLGNDVPELRATIASNKPLFPQYTGLEPEGAVMTAKPTGQEGWPSESDASDFDPKGLPWQTCTLGSKEETTSWAAQWDKENLRLWFPEPETPINHIHVKIEARRLHPTHKFSIAIGSPSQGPDFKRVTTKTGERYVVVRIPFDELGMTSSDLHPIRMDVRVEKQGGKVNTWRPNNAKTYRLYLGTDKPADLGWLIFQN